MDVHALQAIISKVEMDNTLFMDDGGGLVVVVVVWLRAFWSFCFCLKAQGYFCSFTPSFDESASHLAI